MSQGSVVVLSSAQISLPPLPKPTPPTKLSFFDTLWIGLPPIQRLLLYANRSSTDERVSFSAVLECLKSSLSSTLLQFLPLAGKLTYLPSTGHVQVDYSDPGFAFVEAESDVHLHRLIADPVHDTESFLKLVPPLDTSELPFRPLSVQATRFGCGGVAIGYTAHHIVGDGKATWQFLEVWARNCKAEMCGEPQPEFRLPLFDRQLIEHPRGDDITRNFLQSLAPNLPIVQLLASIQDRHKLTRRTFLLDAPTVQSLKQQGMQRNNNDNDNDENKSYQPSTFVAVSAYLWTCFVRAKSLEPHEDSILCFLADCRTRLDPPIHESYFGNCVRGVYVRATVGELIAEDGLSLACKKISKSIAETLEDPVSDVDHWLTQMACLPVGRTTNVVASPRFKVYGIDFGFGRPDRVELVSMNGNGEVALVAGKDEGSIQVTVAADQELMEAYVKAFKRGLSSIIVTQSSHVI